MSRQIAEPFLTAELEDGIGEDWEESCAERRAWHAKALRQLARQLGFANDYYYPLLGAARMLDGSSMHAEDRLKKKQEVSA